MLDIHRGGELTEADGQTVKEAGNSNEENLPANVNLNLVINFETLHLLNKLVLRSKFWVCLGKFQLGNVPWNIHSKIKQRHQNTI